MTFACFKNYDRWLFVQCLGQMLSRARRIAREKALLKACVRYNKGRQQRHLLHQQAAARLRRQDRAENPRGVTLDDLSSLSSGDSSDSGSDSSSRDDWDNILGADWRFAGDLLSDQSTISITGFTSDSDDDVMPDLVVFLCGTEF
ncbi:hypothetical protein C8R45DRAFT_1098261 [Mycena sanguinolenta]|nr:hypothetical protein C8R45DRAFT_1098261 [Mycena sanguinolenta]